MRVILASASPRRRELLGQIISDFDVVVADVDEEALVHEEPVETAVRTARAKSQAVFAKHPEDIVIGGDTVVAIDGVQLAKPLDREDAFRMLRRLSGRTHTVITGICLMWPGGATEFPLKSLVTFKELSDEQIWAYIDTGEPMDKAGAYGAQGEAGRHIERIEGSLTNVIGLPVEEVSEALMAVLRPVRTSLVGRKAENGFGHFRQRMTDFAHLFTEAAGEPLIPGTINVQVPRPIEPVCDFKIPDMRPEDADQDLWFERCLFNGRRAYRIRPYNRIDGSGGHADDIIEIAAPFELSYDPMHIELTFFRKL